MSGEWIDPGRDHWGFEYEIQSPDDKEIAKDNTERLAEMTKMTDDNDNLVDVPEDEWEETPGGHAKLTLDLEPAVIGELITHWANRLSEASREQFDEVLAAEGVEAAVYSAVLNELIIESLTAHIERAEANSNDAA